MWVFIVSYTCYLFNANVQSTLDYDKVDWDEQLDVDDDREAENKWFDEDGD